jgi:SpoVK/Ycf46/Vps4 family AAA+-type ATPase
MAIKQCLCRWLDKQNSAPAELKSGGGAEASSPTIATATATAARAGAGAGAGAGAALLPGLRIPSCMVGTSNRAGAIDASLRRGGRMEYEIAVANTQQDRRQLLQVLLETSADVFFPLRTQTASSNSSSSNAEIERPLAPDDDDNVSAEEDSLHKTQLPQQQQLRGELSSISISISDRRAALVDSAASKIAMQTGGYVAADLSALVRTMLRLKQEQEQEQEEAAEKTRDAERTTQLSQRSNQESGTDISNSNDNNNNISKISDNLLLEKVLKLFHAAAKTATPSCLRGASVSLPQLRYSDVIGYEPVKRSLQRIMSFADPALQALAARFGLNASPGGVLLHGPPGNAKTRLVSAAAAHHGLPMITLSAADIYSPYVGDAEAEIRRAFQLARQAAPCVLFIDELDSIVTNRDGGGSGSGGSSTASVEGRVLATLLTEMDGIITTASTEYAIAVANSGSTSTSKRSNNDSKEDVSGEDEEEEDGAATAHRKVGNSSGGVIVLGATNRLDFIDAALIRKVSAGAVLCMHAHFIF